MEALMDFCNSSDLTIVHLSRLIRRRALSPVDLTRALLARIDRLEPRLNAFITVTADLALAQARRAEKEIIKGAYRGALHGIPICLKDLFYTRGVRTTAGSSILRNFVPAENAAVVERLFDAGAVLLGKTNMHEFAYGATNINPHFGPARNPWTADRMSGGSSGGSAVAVAAGLAVASLGTDTGGSIRIPSAACGCVGLKPTHGRFSLCGVIPLAPSLDHVGPICRCVEDAALLLEVIVGADPCDPDGKRRRGERFARDLRKEMRNLRIGVPKQYFFDHLQPDVRRRVTAAIATMEQNGAELRDVDLKLLGETTRLAGDLTVAEALVYHAKWMRRRSANYGADLRLRLQEGMAMSALAYLQAQEVRRAYTYEFEKALRSVDLLAVPTLPIAAPRLEESEVRIVGRKENVRLALLRLTRPANLTRMPAITVPCGFTSDHLPVGLQLIGRSLDESTLLRAAHAYERLTPWHEMFPSDPA
jgi:aspartyl-tRNA(Asn)/glutamyl-tRNA(Gln) amidotransferase subunit A